MHFPRYTDFQVCVDWGQRLYSKRALDRVPKINLYGHVWTSGTVAIRLYTPAPFLEIFGNLVLLVVGCVHMHVVWHARCVTCRLCA